MTNLPVAKQVMNTLEDKRESLLKAVGGDGLLLDRFLANASMEINGSPSLEKCSTNSLLAAVVSAANFGLMLNKTLGHAYLVPYKGKATLQIGYKGYIHKFEEHKYSIEVELVTKEELEKGYFKEMRGTSPKIEHFPIRDSQLRVEENIALGYAIASKTGRKPIVVVMTLKEILEATKKARRNNGVWNKKERDTDFGEMCKKTVIRRLAKIVPVSITNLMSAHDSSVEEEMKDVTPESTPVDTNMAFISGEEGSGLVDDVTPSEDDKASPDVPEEFPILIQGEMSELFPDPIVAGDFLLGVMEGLPKEERMKCISENGALMKYLIASGGMEMIDQLHKLAGE